MDKRKAECMLPALGFKSMGMQEKTNQKTGKKTQADTVNTLSEGIFGAETAKMEAEMPKKPINTLCGGILGRGGMKIYLSGPITGTQDYMGRFARAEEALQGKGYTIVNPARVNAQLPEGTTHGEYMRMSLDMLEMCDAIFLMEGWQESKGCGMEFEYAYEHKHLIMFEGGRG